MSKPKKKFKVITAWADIGSHGTPFVFCAGPVWSMYGPLMHVWEKKVSADLVPVEIRIPVASRTEVRQEQGGDK